MEFWVDHEVAQGHRAVDGAREARRQIPNYASPVSKSADKSVVASHAKIEIAGLTMEQPVEAGSKGVVFEIDLPSGPTDLVTHLYDNSGKAGGAYFTELEVLPDRVSLMKEEDGGERQ